MSVSSSTFGAVRLTKKDARKFVNQITHGHVKQAAVKSCRRGKDAAAQYVRKGYAVLTKRA